MTHVTGHLFHAADRWHEPSAPSPTRNALAFVDPEEIKVLVAAVRTAFIEMRRAQSPCSGSVCMNRLKDRVRLALPLQYAHVVIGVYQNSWAGFLVELTDIIYYVYTRDMGWGNINWLFPHGSMRSYPRSENLQSVLRVDEALGCFVRDKCESGELEDICRDILMGMASSMYRSLAVNRGNPCSTRRRGDYELGRLDLWEPIIHRLWLQRVTGSTVRLRDLERPCQQLAFHIRLECRWTELLSNRVLVRYAVGSVLRVLLNVEGPAITPHFNISRENGKQRLSVLSLNSSRALVVRLLGTNKWGRRPLFSLNNAYTGGSREDAEVS